MESKVLIIAEAGVNHNGSMENAFRLIDAAVEAGADFVKFQTFKAESLVSKDARKAEYQIENTKLEDETQFEMLKKLEFSHEQHEQLIQYCKEKNIRFFSTAFDLDSLKYLAEIGLEYVKIPSGEITNLPYLRLAGELFKKVILSTGMATMEEVKDAVKVFADAGISLEQITILHCNTDYPTKMEDVNLKAMIEIHREIGTQIGYSDHTMGIEIPVAAVAMGAVIIEKHFTLDRTLPGPDHAASLEPGELKQMVRSIRNVEQALAGSGLKEPSPSEMKNILVARKSIVANGTIKKGDLFTEANLAAKRPGTGISAMDWDLVIGQYSKREFKDGEQIEL